MTVPVPQVSPEAIETVRKWAAKVGGYTKQIVEQAIKLIQMGLGNPTKVDQARTAWNTTAVSAIATGKNGITNALPELEARWTGQGFTAFNGYASNVVAASDSVNTALGGVGGALTEAFNKATETYQAVVSLMGTCGEAIISFVGSTVGAIQTDVAAAVGQVAGAIFEALAKFVTAYTQAVSTVLGILAGYKNAANTATSSIATLGKNLVPALPAAAGDVGSYDPVKKGA